MSASFRFVPAAAAAILLAAGCAPETVPPIGPDPVPPVVGAGQIAQASETLAGLGATGTPHTAGYTRDRFGQPWADTDHNHCDTRDDILARDLTGIHRRRGCVVTSGTLHDPYTGHTITFRRGADSSDVQIDHLYPLHRAWLYGAWSWTTARREKFANDRGNLLAVSGPANQAKGDSGPAEWAPPWRAYRCAYAVDYIDVARAYTLPVTPADRRTLRGMLKSCPERGDS